MNLTEKYQEELNKAKNNLKVAKACKFILDKFNEKEKFEFESLSGSNVNLFPNSLVKYFFFKDEYFFLNFSSKDVKNYIEMYEIKNDLKPSKEVFYILKSIKIIEENKDLSLNILTY